MAVAGPTAERREAAGRPPSGPATLHLVRHGESLWNRLGRVQGQSALAPGLTERGWSQASQVAAALQRALAGGGPPRVVSSDLERARQTAAVIACRLGSGLETSSSLREQRLGLLEGLPFAAELGGIAVGEVVARLWSEPDRRPPGGGESVGDLGRRAEAAVVRLAAGTGPLVVVCHGGFIRSLVARLLAGPDGDLATAGPLPPLANASVTTLVLEPGGPLQLAAAPEQVPAAAREELPEQAPAEPHREAHLGAAHEAHLGAAHEAHLGAAHEQNLGTRVETPA